ARIGATRAVGRRGGRKRAVTLIQKDADGAASIVGDGQIGLAVAVEIAHRDAAWVFAARAIGGGGGGKRAVALVQENAHRSRGADAIAVIGHGQIELAVAVEIGHGQGARAAGAGAGAGAIITGVT